MALPITSAAVSFPRNSFEKKWDEIVVRGKVFRAATHKNHLKNAEKDKLTISVILEKEDYIALNKHRAFDGYKVSGLKKVELKAKELDEEGNPVLEANGDFIYKQNDEGEDLKEFSHYQISFSQNPTYKDKETKEIKDATVKVKVKKGIEYKPTDYIGEGSEVIVKGSLWEWEFQGDKGCSLNLAAIVVVDLQKFETTGGDSFDGMDINMDDFEDVEVPEFNAPATKQTPTDTPAQASTDTKTDIVDIIDEEDPFK